MFNFFYCLLRKISLVKFHRYFRRVARLGEGGFGDVYLVSRKQDNKLLVVKEFEKNKVLTYVITDEGKRLPLEIQILNSIKHTNIVPLLGYIETNLHFLMIMDYDADCVDLYEYLDIHSTLTESTSRKIIVQVHSALTYLFAYGIDQRDLKDENVLVNKITLKAKLIDFGAASLYNDNEPYTKGRGTEIFLPPEFFLIGSYFPVDSAVWALGCMLYKMVMGFHPFSDKYEIQYMDVAVNEFISSDCKSLIYLCLTKQNHKRILFHNISLHPWCKNKH